MLRTGIKQTSTYSADGRSVVPAHEGWSQLPEPVVGGPGIVPADEGSLYLPRSSKPAVVVPVPMARTG
jgi:hypothetical protein